MKITKNKLPVLFLTIKGTEGQLTLAEGRIRDVFMKEVTELTSTYEGDKKIIYEKFCKKNEDGTPDTTGDQYKFDPKEVPKVNEEIQTLNDEEVEISVQAPNDKLKEIIERTAYKPLVGEAEIIDSILALL